MRLGVVSRTGSIAAVAGAMMLALNSGGFAEDVSPSRHSMLGKLPEKDWYPFVAGMIEGVAFHRYMAMGKDAALMNCIYDWFYKEDGALKSIYAALNQFPDYPPASVVNALAKKKCGGE